MLITMYCHVSVGSCSTDEEVEVEVPADFSTWEESAQHEYLQDAFDGWLNSNHDSGFSFSAPPPEAPP